ncbi:TetR/AcrR family transcriptional regulator [Agromyces sp. Soil535]|uniref:TetR/AcrR family transcriptional regulator n=1 Tax=Agromyces sp. Soil535 TaxID=1736390 RepID=UPI0006FE0D06|nr:TetR/AcrR family transcriptional regulator [Agromyces sp. Soil535]KRE22300.1 hypothetical protein ASG80_10160 [Agromyces sp. Soil535]
MARLTREQSRALTREKLLTSAGDVVAREGYDGASVERIADEAGFSKGAFYSNFASKEDILLHLLEGNAGNDVRDLTELLQDLTDPDLVIDAIVRWSDARAAEQKWGIIAIEFLRRAKADGTLTDRERSLFVLQWESIGRLLIAKLFPDADPPVSPIDLGGIVLDLTYGGISSFLEVNTTGGMIRQVLEALRIAAAADVAQEET